MTARLNPRALYAVAGQDGPWRYVGQAYYVDDDGRRVEHSWVRMVQDDAEVWCDPDGVAPHEVLRMPLHLARDLPA